MKATVRTPLRPTESPQRVREALLRFFPDAQVQQGPDGLVATTADLRPLRHRVWELRIIDTFRGQFLHGMDPDRRRTRVRLSKQAALAGRVSFSPRPHPLGDLELTVEAEPGDAMDVEGLAWWLAPETRDGEIVGPVDP